MSRQNPYFLLRADRRLGDRYELLECLGDGSYGWVWRAQRLEDNTIVAVKIPKEQGAKNEELAEGAALVGAEPHPNIIRLFWMGRVPPEKEWYAIEMEYFPNQTLAQLIEQDDPQFLDSHNQAFLASYERVLSIYQQVLAGVGHLHKLGMSHGDIKPQNILVSGDLIKLTDFGCSVLPEEMYARTRQNGGTILYSAPEVVGSSWQGHSSHALLKADVYSLGVLLYYLVTARLPHDTLSQVARHTPFPRPREINSSICPELEDLILQCLALNPEERWDSVEEMAITFGRVHRLQLDYSPIRPLPLRKHPSEDWSSQAVRLSEEGCYRQAEYIATKEFERSGDLHAFLLMLKSAYKDNRYFDCLQLLDSHPEILLSESPLLRDLRRTALATYIETRQIQKADEIVEKCLLDDSISPEILMIKASLLGLQAKYEESSKILLSLNRQHPGKPSILKRLVLVFEQLRDTGKAMSFLRAYLKAAPDDAWALRRLERLSAMGIR
jgi:eukaryotic-like serine/threonine-protein kinase